MEALQLRKPAAVFDIRFDTQCLHTKISATTRHIRRIECEQKCVLHPSMVIHEVARIGVLQPLDADMLAQIHVVRIGQGAMPRAKTVTQESGPAESSMQVEGAIRAARKTTVAE
jgi:hypothetical protein